jgi:CDP-paratose 2-epimerase
VTAFDNLHRRGSELALPRLRSAGVEFVHGDVRITDDVNALPPADLIIDASAEPSVQAGYGGDPRYLLNTNLGGTLNCLEYARRHGSRVIFLSTSRVYSMAALRALPLHPARERLALPAGSGGTGWSEGGISEDFPTTAPRSLYGTSKLASELLVEEYAAAFGVPAIVNRCGVIAGPWQMGKVDQGFFALWAACHLYGRRLRYIGFGGTGRQVRDVLHIADLFDLLSKQDSHFERHAGRCYNIGGGNALSISLAELNAKCREQTGSTLEPEGDPTTRAADVPYFVTDIRAVTEAAGWVPKRSLDTILADTLDWLRRCRAIVEPVLE